MPCHCRLSPLPSPPKFSQVRASKPIIKHDDGGGFGEYFFHADTTQKILDTYFLTPQAQMKTAITSLSCFVDIYSKMYVHAKCGQSRSNLAQICWYKTCCWDNNLTGNGVFYDARQLDLQSYSRADRLLSSQASSSSLFGDTKVAGWEKYPMARIGVDLRDLSDFQKIKQSKKRRK